MPLRGSNHPSWSDAVKTLPGVMRKRLYVGDVYQLPDGRHVMFRGQYHNKVKSQPGNWLDLDSGWSVKIDELPAGSKRVKRR